MACSPPALGDPAGSRLPLGLRRAAAGSRTAGRNENAASIVPPTITTRAASRMPSGPVSRVTARPPTRAASGITPQVAVRNAACITPWFSALIRDCRIGALHTLMHDMKKP